MNPPSEERSSIQGGTQRRELEPSRKVDPPGIWEGFLSKVIGIGQQALDLAVRWGEASVRSKELDNDIKSGMASDSIGRSRSRADSLCWGTEAEVLKTTSHLMNQLLPGEALAIVLEKQKLIQSKGGTVKYQLREHSPVDALPGAGLGKPGPPSEMGEHVSIANYSPTIGIITALARESAAVRAILAPTSHYVVGCRAQVGITGRPTFALSVVEFTGS